MIAFLGASCAVAGSVVSVIGNLINTIKKDHYRAIVLWTFSSALIVVWASGFLLGWWNGGIGVAAILAMNCVFLASNLWWVMKELQSRLKLRFLMPDGSYTTYPCNGCKYYQPTRVRSCYWDLPVEKLFMKMSLSYSGCWRRKTQ